MTWDEDSNRIQNPTAKRAHDLSIMAAVHISKRSEQIS
jgi:hypothetical protein